MEFDGVIKEMQGRFGLLTGGGVPKDPFGANGFGKVPRDPFASIGRQMQDPFSGVRGFNVRDPFGNMSFGLGSGGSNNFLGNTSGLTRDPLSNVAFTTPDAIMARRAKEKAAQDAQFASSRGRVSSTVTEADGSSIDAWIAKKRPNSRLIGTGGFIADYARQRGVDVAVVLGIMMKETQLGSDQGEGTVQNNWGNIVDLSRDEGLGKTRYFRGYATREEGIKAMIDLLADPMYAGKSIEEVIGTWYVGPKEFAINGLNATDRAGNGTVGEYVADVRAIQAEIGALPGSRQGGGGFAGGASDANWEAIAKEYTTAKWVDYTNYGIRNTGNPADGFDCSSLVGYLLNMPKNQWNAQVQFDNTARVNAEAAQAGDMVFFQGTNPNDPSARPVSHVGIYLGNGLMLHTGTPGKGIEVVNINTDPYWKRHFYGFGRR